MQFTFDMSADLMLNYTPKDTIMLNCEAVNLAFGSSGLIPGIHKVELVVNIFNN
ncbi:hypothetical protein I5M32_11600 [Pedobacter sp. SD-b]|uniref:Uncharacterized protein n=1 Tax=Pedobacter segetis TaxID=2793069 RepID=A0ABS1BL52_9SPHI|nr:hypothetical protein [Pedobacter segetis]MBK0383602.1 hypothetical protein [Pedobacter segetis]